MPHKFSPEHAEKLNDPQRLAELDPPALWEALGRPSPRAIVDIGAGTGLVTAAFARLAPDARVYAADLSPEMLSWQSAHLPADVAGRIEPVLAEETRVPLADGVADLVTMVALFHELDDAGATLRDVRRLLAVGGTLLIVDYKPEDDGPGPVPPSRVSAEEIEAAIRAAGFVDVVSHDVLSRFSVLSGTRA